MNLQLLHPAGVRDGDTCLLPPMGEQDGGRTRHRCVKGQCTEKNNYLETPCLLPLHRLYNAGVQSGDRKVLSGSLTWERNALKITGKQQHL